MKNPETSSDLYITVQMHTDAVQINTNEDCLLFHGACDFLGGHVRKLMEAESAMTMKIKVASLYE